MKDPYEVLGVSSSATAEEIKSAYRKMAKQYHPDLHPGDSAAAEKMNEINAAYDILSDPEKLAAYRAGAYDAPKTAQGAYYYGTYDPFSAYGKTRAYGNSGQYGQYGQYGPGPGGQNDHPYGSYENPYDRTQNTYQTGRRIYIRPLGFFGFFGRFVRIMFTFLILRAVLRFILILLLSF